MKTILRELGSHNKTIKETTYYLEHDANGELLSVKVESKVLPKKIRVSYREKLKDEEGMFLLSGLVDIFKETTLTPQQLELMNTFYKMRRYPKKKKAFISGDIFDRIID